MVRLRAKIEKNTLFGRGLVKLGEKIEKTPFVVRLWLGSGKNRKNTVFGRGLVKIRAKIEKTPFVARLWLRLGQKREKHPFW